jgi:AcrR family transcriptional regulator
MREHKASPRARPDDQKTRQRLLEAAGQVFAEKGFDRATGKEIAERAGTNAAAVNYYFGGMDGLYAAVVRTAHDRLVTLDAFSAAIAGKTGAEAKLRAIVELIVRTLTSPVASSWVLRVMGREIVAPSPAHAPLLATDFLPRTRIMRGIVSELTGLPENHPTVVRGCISTLSPCFMLLIFDRASFTRVFPEFGFRPDDVQAIVDHLVRFALAGLSAVTTAARKRIPARRHARKRARARADARRPR